MLGIDLFSGAGGMSLGAKWAGIDVRVAIELHPWVARTYSVNHPNTTVIQASMAQLSGIHFRRSQPITRRSLPITEQPLPASTLSLTFTGSVPATAPAPWPSAT